MKRYVNANQNWRTGSVRKKFYHSRNFDYPDTLKENSPTKEKDEKVKIELKYSFVVPWQMD